MSKQIDFTKPVQTKNGLPVRILCTDAPGSQPIVGIVNDEPQSWYTNGQFFFGEDNPSNSDLENVPSQKITKEIWLNIYEDRITPHKTKRDADLYRSSNCQACIKTVIEYTEGEGL